MRTSSPALIEEFRRRGWWSDVRITDLFDKAVLSNPAGLAVVENGPHVQDGWQNTTH